MPVADKKSYSETTCPSIIALKRVKLSILNKQVVTNKLTLIASTIFIAARNLVAMLRGIFVDVRTELQRHLINDYLK